MGHPSPQTRGVTDYGVLGFRKKGRRHHVRMNLVSVSRSLLGQGASPRQWTKEEGDEEALGWCRTTIAHERFILNLDVAVHQDVDEPNECGCAQRPCAHHDPLQLSPLVQASYVGRPGGGVKMIVCWVRLNSCCGASRIDTSGWRTSDGYQYLIKDEALLE